MLKVCKFGGSSVATSYALDCVKNAVCLDKSREIIVVSAQGRFDKEKKLTDVLIDLYEDFFNKKVEFYNVINVVFSRLYSSCKAFFDSEFLTKEILDFCEKALLYGGVEYDKNYFISRGEYISAKIVASMLGYTFMDAVEIVAFYDDGNLDISKTFSNVTKLLNGGKYVIPGFYGSNDSGNIILFPRGGSDITGAVIASALKADVYENWTDVYGIYEIDTASKNYGKTIEKLSYGEYFKKFGNTLQVLDYRAVKICADSKTPIKVLNTFDNSGKFTYIGFC